MKRALAGGIVLLLGVALGCSNRVGNAETSTRIPPPEDLPDCDEVFAEDQTIDRGTFADACRMGDDMAVPRPVQFECEDGRTFVWNDFAFGYVGEPMTLVAAEEDDRSAPVAEALRCVGPGGAAGGRPSGGQGQTTTTAAETSGSTTESTGDPGSESTETTESAG